MKEKSTRENMASRPKRKYVSVREKDAMLEAFYNDLDEEDALFLGNRFVGEDDGDDNDYQASSESDNNEADAEADMTDPEPEIEVEPVAENVEMENAANAVNEEIVANAVNEETVDLPKKQRFKNLSEVLNENNYVDVPSQPNRTFKYSDAKKTVNMTWKTKKDRNVHKEGAENIYKNKPGPRGAAKSVKTPLASLKLFFTDEMIMNIVQYTNDSIQPVLERFADLLENSNKYPHFKLVDRIDIEAFIGILYLRAAFRVNLLSKDYIWNHESSYDSFGATMSVNRFKFISRFITFDDKSTRADRWKTDKFACMREIFEEMNVRNAKMRSPSSLLAVDETLYPYRGRIGFKQYNPSKPAKYGLLYRSLCDSTVTYTYFTLPYAGKPEVIDGDAAKYYVTGTDEYTKYLVNGFSAYGTIQGCNISMDRYFTSVFLAEWALEKKFTIVGTMRHNRKGIPKELKALTNRDERSVLHVYHTDKKIMMASYIDKKKSGKKNVIVLSTMHEDVKVTNDQRKKPQIHTMYDHTKGGVDVVDLLASSHSTRIKSKRWPLNAFAFILDTCRSNAKTIMEDNGIKLSNFEFTYNIGKALVLPAIKRRYKDSNGLQIVVINKMRRVLGIKEVRSRPEVENICVNHGRCFKCVEAIVGTPAYKIEREKLNNKLKTKCSKCLKFICKPHQYQMQFICEDCNE